MSTSKVIPVTREELRDALKNVLNHYAMAMLALGRDPIGFENSSEVWTARALLARLDAEDK